jgi:hypothetical protein
VLPSIEQTEPARTVIVPRVEPPAVRSRLRLLLTWLAFGAVAVVVVVGTTLWSVTLRSSASRAAPEPAGIGTAAAVPVAPSLAALPTTPAAPMTTAAVVRGPAPRPRVVAPPPPVPVRHSVPAPSAPPPADPAPSVLPDPVGCAEPPCAESSDPPPRTRKGDGPTTLSAAQD